VEEVLWCRRSRSLCAVNESHSRDRCLSYLPSIYGLISPQTLFLRSKLLVDEHSCSEALPYKFNGKQFDEETGLYYYGARYMNPMASIWYGVDPLAEKFPLISGYSYCGGSPIILRDKDGRRPTGHETVLMEGLSIEMEMKRKI